MLSILSQRQVLHPGDATPVIGIVYMAGIQLCQVVVRRGELTDSNQIQYQLATATDPDAGVGSGVFRLQQASELYAFARFLLGTASEGTQLINVCSTGSDSETDTARVWRDDRAAIFMPDDHSQICGDRENKWQLDRWLREATGPRALTDDMSTVRETKPQQCSIPGSRLRSLYVSNSDYESRSGRATAPLSQEPDRLLGSTILDPLDFEYPGIAEWSFDHLVLTICFAPSSASLDHHKLAFDSMSAMLFPYLDISIETCRAASEPTLSRWHAASLKPHACNALNEIVVEALSIVISKSFAEDCIHMTAPASYGPWMKAMDWFSARWRCKASTRCLPSFIHWPSVRMHHARCVAYERHLDALEASQRLIESPELRTSIKHSWPFMRLQFLCNSESRNHLLASLAICGDGALSEEHMSNLSRFHELTAAAKNASNMFSAVSDLKKDIKFDDHEDILRHGHLVAQQIKRRLPKYPLWGDGYGMVSAAVNALFTDEQLLNVLDTAMIADIQNTLQFTVPRGETRSTQEQDPEHAADALHLPILLINYQDYGITLEDSTRNHMRLGCASAAYYLSFLGITDFPVYGLSICGPYGTLSMAWYSSTDECCYNVDGNTIHYRFDLTHENDVRRYIAFLSKIEELGRELLERFEAARPALLERMKTEKGRASLRWTAQSQLEDHGLEPEQLAEEKPRDVMEALAEYTANATEGQDSAGRDEDSERSSSPLSFSVESSSGYGDSLARTPLFRL
ncbi:hypothetical protein C8Q73DRAFT_452676 [Cubamyces lactineus]|nr:hypothetical protein C8Q73DRAFT_452676 [Cubamyces lactineus]